MYLVLWILAFPTILYHSFLFLFLLLIFLYHKGSHYLFKSSSTSARVAHYQEYLRSKQDSLIRMYNKKFISGKDGGRVGAALFANSQFKGSTQVVVVLLALVLIVHQCSQVSCLEEDAVLLKPFADVAKSIISAVTLGKPLPIEIKSSDLARSLVKFSWRTGFPVTLPKNFAENGTKFYNDILARVNATNVDNVTRKRLVNLKVDLDNIVDSLTEHVRQSPQGLYSNWLETKVGEKSFEEACYEVGLQFKAYGIDIANYRNIAGAVLGVPVVPTVASHMVSAGKAAKPIAQLPGAAINTMASMSGSAINTLSSNLPFSRNSQSAAQVQLASNSDASGLAAS